MADKLIEREKIRTKIIERAKDICGATFPDKDCVFKKSHNCTKTRGSCVDWRDEIEDAAIDIIAALTAENEQLKQELRISSIEFSRCLPGGGGSEWFKRIGDESYLDPAICAASIRYRLDSGNQAKIAVAKARALKGDPANG